jgi:hypothetical protein
MSRFQRSIALAKASWSVLRSDRSIAWFPVLSGVTSVLVVALLGLIGFVTADETTTASGSTHYSASVATFVIAIVGYVAVAYLQTYFLAGLVASADDVLQGRRTTVGRGLAVASSRAGRLLPWAIVSATVSYVLQAIEERLGFVGAIISTLLGAAWQVVTFLAVPIIVFEDVGPIHALKRSGSLLKQTWGENIIGQGAIGLLAFLPMLAGVGIGVLGVASGTAVVAVPLVVVGAVVVLATVVVASALSGIYRTALYRYAVDGQVPVPFVGVDMEHAFGPRRNRGGF